MNNYDKNSRNKLIQKITNGFTIVELLVIIAIIGVMSTIGIVSFSSIQSNARNTQRSSRVTILSEALEKYYDANGEYPSCAAMTASSGTVTSTTLKGLDPEVLAAPNAAKGTNSITCNDIASPDSFVYLGGVTQYSLKYKEEDSSAAPKLLDSRRRVATATYTLTIAADIGGTVNTGGTYSDGTSQTITATPSTYYSFNNWTGSTGCAGVASHTITMDANKTCTANFSAIAITPDPPATPVVTAPVYTDTQTQFSWGATSCTSSTARYQYRYTISPSGYDSGLIATAATSIMLTTSTEGQTYTVSVQAQCYNTATSTGWSASGSKSYFRAATQYNLATIAGTGGTVSAGGLYNLGSTPTITATASTYYSFTSWTGTNCSGTASHAVPAMTANMSCTANFTATTITPPATPIVTPNTVTTTTTFSWGAASCPGNTARYQYRYTISPSGYDSGLVATAATSVAFTTSTEGQTYTVATQAQCYNAVTSSSWSASGSGSYLRPKTWKQISSGGDTTCAISSENKAYCWGRGGNGQLGNGSMVDSLVPVAVSTSGVLSGKTILFISTGYVHSCAIASDNQTYCWGGTYGNHGLGNGTVAYSSIPVAITTSGVLSGKTILSISAGVDTTCLIASDNQAYCWGENGSGTLGNGTYDYSLVPVAVVNNGVLNGKTIKSITAGNGQSCAIASDNKAYCWGYGKGVGYGSWNSINVPVAVSGNRSVLAISAKGYLTGCYITSSNIIYCWGENGAGELGNNSVDVNTQIPVAVYTAGVLSGKTITSITTGQRIVCVTDSNNQAYCWGSNQYGKLGNNSTINSSVPVAVDMTGYLSGKTIQSISSGYSHNCAIASDDQVYCWGANYGGQLGNNSIVDSMVPTTALSPP